MCIVQKARGEPATETTFYRAGGLPPGQVMQLPRVRRIPSAASEEEELVVALGTGALLAVVSVLGSPYVRWQETAYPNLQSRFGRLARPGPHGGALHAIVLVGRVAGEFHALDPHFPAHSPIRIDDDAFASFFGGHAYVADP